MAAEVIPSPSHPAPTHHQTVVLVRHGAWHRANRDDEDGPLSKQGRAEMERLGGRLLQVGLRPTLFLTSGRDHALQSVDILNGILNKDQPAPCKTISALTPKTKERPRRWPRSWLATIWARSPDTKEEPPDGAPTAEPLTWEAIVDEAPGGGTAAGWFGVALGREAVVVVGHEARLSQLAMRLIGQRIRPLARAEAVGITAPGPEDLLLGRGTLAFRLPVVDHQEDRLREKVASKMTASTVLAGFTFAALIEVLLGRDGGAGWACHEVAAVACLTLAAALFTSAIIMYDRLAMPPGFWAYQERRRPRGLPRPLTWLFGRRAFEENVGMHGPLYAHMVWTWTFVVGVGLGFVLLGFLAILVGSRDATMIALGALAVVVAGTYHVAARPRLGSD